MGKLNNVILEVGDLAVSLKGHDTGKVYAVVSTEDEFVFVADGKTRPVSHPKRKRRKHLKFLERANVDIDDLSIKRLIKNSEENNAERR